MGTSVLHIKTEVECRVYLFDEEKGISKPGTWFNLEVRKGEQDLLFVGTEDESVRSHIQYNVEENDCDYRMIVEQSQFMKFSPDLLEEIREAKRGDAEAQFRLGERYYNGKGLEKDYIEAVRWLLKSAEQGNDSAQFFIGKCYNDGNGVEQDYDKAVQWYYKSAIQGNVHAQYEFGKCEEYGLVEDFENPYIARQWYRKAAKQGCIEAMYRFFHCLYEEDYNYIYDYSEYEDQMKEGLMWLREAACRGHVQSQYELGLLYEKGNFVRKDQEEAVKWFHEAAEHGNVDAQLNLGKRYYLGFGVDKNHQEAVKWYRKAAELGNAHAQEELANIYNNDDAVEHDKEEALKWYRRAAELGNADAQNKLADMYYNGDGVGQDKEKVVKWYRKAAELGNAFAQNSLADIYYIGDGVKQDMEEAVKWYRMSAEQGYLRAIYHLGMCYYWGKGIEIDYAEAVKWYSKAADKHSHLQRLAQFMLGYCYANGKGVEQDYREAVKWYQKSAEKGDFITGFVGYNVAQFCLGWCYEKGKGVEQDYVEAVKWYSMAAEQGYAAAQNNLGLCYKNGVGVEQNYAEALMWFRRAAEKGNEHAKSNLKSLEDKMKKEGERQKPTHSYYIFFDTETTGVPRDYKASASNTRNWPRLVQLGWIVTDEEGNVLSQGNEIVKPEGFVIPADAARLHGITTERAQREGKPLREVIEAFLKDAEQTKCIVGHNISFDQKVVGAELYRLGIPDTISTAKSICTMEAWANYCKIPGYMGYKWPKLQELHHKLFGCDFEDAHDAMADITATKKCFFEMRKRGLI